MEKHGAETLTAGQLDCLRLVAQLQSSKQIARQLGISRHTVDQRIARACRQLGVATRADAARAVVRMRQETTHDFPETAQTVLDRNESKRPAISRLTTGMAEDDADFGDELIVSDGKPFGQGSFHSAPFPTAGRRHNDLTLITRIGWAAVICAGSILVFGALLASLTALNSLF